MVRPCQSCRNSAVPTLVVLGLLAGPAITRAHVGEWTHDHRSDQVEHKYESKGSLWKEEHKGPGWEHKFEMNDGEWKEEFKDKHCEIKREQKRDGEYKEERKCR